MYIWFFKNDEAPMMRRYRHGKAVVRRESTSAKAPPVMARSGGVPYDEREVLDVLDESHFLYTQHTHLNNAM